LVSAFIGYSPGNAAPLLTCSTIQPSIRSCSQYGAILIGDDNVIWKYRNAAASDRFAPADECQPCDRRRRREAVAPYGKPGAEHALDIAHNAIGDQRRHPALDHAGA
jgi:hypothetical protein